MMSMLPSGPLRDLEKSWKHARLIHGYFPDDPVTRAFPPPLVEKGFPQPPRGNPWTVGRRYCSETKLLIKAEGYPEFW